MGTLASKSSVAKKRAASIPTEEAAGALLGVKVQREEEREVVVKKPVWPRLDGQLST